MLTNIDQPKPITELMALLKPTFEVFMACENQAAFFQAQKVLDQVEVLCGQDCKITRVFWNFALLRHPELRQHAVREAAGADMIVLSLGGGQELAPHVKSWIEGWPARPQAGRGALVTLVGAGVDTAAAWPAEVAFLRGMAQSRGLEFFCNREGWEPAGRGFDLEGGRSRAAVLARLISYDACNPQGLMSK